MLVEVLRAFLIAATVFLAAFYIITACFVFRQPKPRRHSDIIPHMVSVIIPAHNEEGVIPSLLRDLKNPSFPIAETIVIDDHSDDGTADVARAAGALAASLPIRRGGP